MPATITPDERRLIEQAIADGRMQVCPPRTFALDAAAPGGIRAIQAAGLANYHRGRRLAEAAAREKQPAKRRGPKTETSPDKLAEMAQTMTNRQIAEELGVTPKAVRLRLARMGLKAQPATRQDANAAAWATRRAKAG